MIDYKKHFDRERYLFEDINAHFQERTLRDKDRFLYGRSNVRQLRKDIQRSFGVADKQHAK
jgi:hypothetical protein